MLGKVEDCRKKRRLNMRWIVLIQEPTAINPQYTSKEVNDK